MTHEQPRPDGPTYLYRAYDDADQLVYVGIAVNWTRRWAQHAERSPWFDEVRRVELQTYATRDEAREAERVACVTEKPLHNIEHTDRDTRPARMRRTNRAGRWYVRSFDHRQWQQSPEYRALADAIDAAANALGADADDPITERAFEELLVDLARTVAYGDSCALCQPEDEYRAYPPRAGFVEGEGITTSHRCDRGHEWTCWWHLDAPGLV